MKGCSECRVEFSGDLALCPLCGNKLSGDAVASPFPSIAAYRMSLTARVVLLVVTALMIGAAIALCVVLGASVVFCILSCIAIALNYVFVRNLLVHSPGPMRAIQRYYLVLTACCVLWFFATGNADVATFVVPAVCILGSACNIALLVALGSKFVAGYAKYIMFAALLGVVPLVLLASGCIEWPVLAWISAAFAVLLLLTALIVGRSGITEEAKKLFHA